MDYEKKYKEALKWMQSLYNGLHGATKEDAEHYFPELKESEDERIRQELCDFLRDNMLHQDAQYFISWLERQGENKDLIAEIKNRKALLGAEKEKAISSTDKLSFGARIAMLDELLAWVKKQGEKKPTDEVEPKFKVGNWYQCTKDFFGKGVTFDKNTAYYCAKEGCLLDGCHIAIVKDLYDNFKLWTIADAKEGDVLAVNDEVFIYAHKMYSSVDAHCFVDSAGGFYLDGEFGYTEKGNSIHPATKEQRDTLFAEMKALGYEWDNEKKELKKIEPKPLNADKVIEWLDKQACLGWLEDVEVEKVVEQFKKDFGL